MLDLMLGIDGVQQRTKRTFETRTPKAPKRRAVLVRVTVAAGLRALADRLEPVGAGRASEVAGAYPR